MTGWRSVQEQTAGVTVRCWTRPQLIQLHAFLCAYVSIKFSPYLQSLFGFLWDAAFWGKKCGCRRCYCDFWWELGNYGRNEKLWHVGWDAGADSAGVWKLWLLIAGILLLVWERKEKKKIQNIFKTHELSISTHVSCSELFLSHWVKGSYLGKVVRCYMWQFPPGTSLLLILALAIQWRVSSADKGATPAVYTKAPLRAPLAPLCTEEKKISNNFMVKL